jgi:hypothetical protein
VTFFVGNVECNTTRSVPYHHIQSGDDEGNTLYLEVKYSHRTEQKFFDNCDKLSADRNDALAFCLFSRKPIGAFGFATTWRSLKLSCWGWVLPIAVLRRFSCSFGIGCFMLWEGGEDAAFRLLVFRLVFFPLHLYSLTEWWHAGSPEDGDVLSHRIHRDKNETWPMWPFCLAQLEMCA